MRAGMMAGLVAAAFVGLVGCDGQPVDAVLPGGDVSAEARAGFAPEAKDAEAPVLPPDQGMGGSGNEGLDTEETEAAASAQSLLWSRTLLGGGVRPVGR